MKFQLYIIFLLFYQSIAFGQQNYINYAEQISQAESAVLHDNFAKAFSIYDTTFATYEKCFPNDVFIAAQVASLQKEYSKCFRYLQKGFEWGLNLTVLKYPAFSEFNLSKYHDSILTIYDAKHSVYLSRINNEFRLKCLQLYFRDQKANKTHRIRNIIIPPFAKYAEQKLDDTCAVLLEELRQLSNYYGQFPSISSVGVRDTVPSNQNTSIDGRDYLIVATLFWHYPFAFQENKELLYEALKAGNLSSWHYALIRDFAKTHYDNSRKKNTPKFHYTNYEYNVYWLNPNESYSKDLVEKFNKSRAEIGLMSLEDEQLKKLRSIQYNSYIQKENITESEKKYLVYFDYYYL